MQWRAARFVTRNFNYEIGSMTGILGGQLKWESFTKRRIDNRLIILYKGLKGKASLLKKWIQFLECSWNHEYFGSRAK